MGDARRGEVWLVDSGEPLGHEQGYRRPVVVVSSDEWNQHAATCVVVPLTRTRHGLPTRTEVEPSSANGLDAVCCARAEDVRSISDRRLVQRMGSVDVVVQSSIDVTLRRMLEL